MLVSGTGTILEALVDAGVPVVTVLADRPCRALEVAGSRGVEAVLLDRGAWGGYGERFDRIGFTGAVRDALVARSISLVAMAGFGTVLTESIHRDFAGRILNTHPSLLPAYPGWHAVADALGAGARVTGCTVHLATLDLDAGPVLAQEQVHVAEGDTVGTLHERIKAVERRLYPRAVLALLSELGTPVPHAAHDGARALR